MIIKRIKIKHFRSILDAEFECNDLNIFVGSNDAGKSNFLRALNLFFNGMSDLNSSFNFDIDFSKFAVTPEKKAPEIKIELEIKPPSNYSLDYETVVWRKVWRRNGEQIDSNVILYPDGSEIAGKKKVFDWIRKIKFRYVPAVKGTEYFEFLLEDLHDTLAVSIEDEIKNASKQFVDTLQKNTKGISQSLSEILGIDSKLHLPTNLKNLFATLDFLTDRFGQKIGLKQRGDGIKTLHIPIILKFLSDQVNLNLQKGSPRNTTIWGYEEPENNLELSKTFEMAENFLNYSQDIQIFTTTHSPGFYSLKEADNSSIRIFNVESNDKQTTTLQEVSDTKEINYKMGLMPILSVYLKDKKAEIENLREQILNYEKSSKQDTIVVEGPTDEVIMLKAIELFSDKLNRKLKSNEIGFRYNIEGGGHDWVLKIVKSHAYSDSKNKLLAIFDKDEVGISSKKEADQDKRVEKAKNEKRLSTKTFDVPKHFKLQSKCDLFFSIEEIIKPTFWETAKNKGLLIARTNFDEIIKVKFPPTKSLLEFLSEEFNLAQESRIYFEYKVDPDRKKKFAYFISNLEISEQKDALEYFENLVKEIENFFL